MGPGALSAGKVAPGNSCLYNGFGGGKRVIWEDVKCHRICFQQDQERFSAVWDVFGLYGGLSRHVRDSVGAQTVYPTSTGANQTASEKEYPSGFSHSNTNGRDLRCKRGGSYL